MFPHCRCVFILHSKKDYINEMCIFWQALLLYVVLEYQVFTPTVHVRTSAIFFLWIVGS
jgi:hypothetical protein